MLTFRVKVFDLDLRKVIIMLAFKLAKECPVGWVDFSGSASGKHGRAIFCHLALASAMGSTAIGRAAGVARGEECVSNSYGVQAARWSK